MGMVFIPYSQTIRHHGTMGGDYFIADVVENSFNPFLFSDDYTIFLLDEDANRCKKSPEMIHIVLVSNNSDNWSKLNGLKIKFEFQYIATTSAISSLRTKHCDVEYFDCNGWKPQTIHYKNVVSQNSLFNNYP